MKTKEYISKYNLNKGDRFNHNHFVQDLTIDFMSLLEVGKAKENIKGYENAVRAIRMKWDGINNKTVGQLPEKLWNYFYATVVGQLKDQLFPEILERRKKEAAERKVRREEYQRFEKEQEEEFNRWMWESWFIRMASIFKNMAKPVASFQVMGLDPEGDVTEEDVKKAFRELSFTHHPDHGGKSENFNALIEAKNKCLSYIKSRTK